MKKVTFLLASFLCVVFDLYAAVPVMNLKTIDGTPVTTKVLSEKENPIIVTFFATWCKPCLRELKAINEVYSDWQDETGVELVAISIDDVQSQDKVKSLVDGLGWEYTVWFDSNGDFKRALGVNLIPAVFVIYNGKIVLSKNGYTDGSEVELIDKIRELQQSIK